MIIKGNPSKAILAKERILEKCGKLGTTDEKIIYLSKVISDGNRIINLVEKLGENNFDENSLKKLGQDIDENLIWFLDNGGELQHRANYKVVREEKKYYLVTRAGSNIVREMKNIIDGLENMRYKFEEEVAIIETVDSKEEKAALGTGNRIKAKSGITDIVRIFEAMKEEEVIWSNTPVKDIAELFFIESADKYLFEKRYNSIKSRLKKEESSSNSEALIRFVITLCRKSFNDKEYALEKIIRSLEEIQKNITSRI